MLRCIDQCLECDQIFTCRQNQVAIANIDNLGFTFEIFASGEYSRLFEREWAEQEVSAQE